MMLYSALYKTNYYLAADSGICMDIIQYCLLIHMGSGAECNSEIGTERGKPLRIVYLNNETFIATTFSKLLDSA